MIKNAFSFVLVLSGLSLAGVSLFSETAYAGDRGKAETAIGLQLANSLDGVRLAQKAGKKSDDDDDELLSKDDDDDDDKLLSKDDDDDDDDDKLLSKDDDDDDEKKEADAGEKSEAGASEEHAALFAETRFPSAGTCGTCHPKQYGEWSVSQHSYAQLSPVYLSLNNKINELANGSNGDFCLRCHNPVGANLGENSFVSNLERHPTSREGVTCVVCHRLDRNYNKASGRLALVEGGLTEAVYGPLGNKEMARVLENPQDYNVVIDPNEPGRKVHKEIKKFASISSSTFCGACHDVTLFNGFRLEEAFSEYRTSPAAGRGETCQDCHMGKEQGKVSGYAMGPAAVVGGVPTEPRKLTNHFFAGPDYSVIHPGIFPHNSEAQQMATLAEWLTYNVGAGWGTDKFEDEVTDATDFPPRWQSVDDRYDAREILNTQLARLEWARKQRLEVLRNGYIMGDIVTERSNAGGIAFKVQVRNGTDGHNAPTGFSGERLVWLQVTVTDSTGKVIFKSGDRDPNGDVRDGHSSYVHAGELELDQQLFSLQSIFVTQNARGGEIEHVIPIPYPVTALPRVLPSTVSLIFTGEPSTERNHKMGIEPHGERWAPYKIEGNALTGKGPYRADIKLISQPAPVNLLVAMQSVGFDYGITPRQAGEALVAGAQVLWQREVVFDVK